MPPLFAPSAFAFSMPSRCHSLMKRRSIWATMPKTVSTTHFAPFGDVRIEHRGVGAASLARRPRSLRRKSRFPDAGPSYSWEANELWQGNADFLIIEEGGRREGR